MRKETVVASPHQLEEGDIILRADIIGGQAFLVGRVVKPVLVDGLTACKAYREGKKITREEGAVFSKYQTTLHLIGTDIPIVPDFLLDGWEIIAD